MQKTKLLTITIMAALLVCSALSFVAAQEEIPPATPNTDATTNPEQPVNPDETINPDNSRSSDEPVGYGDDILYTIQDNNATDTSGQEPMPYGDEIYANGFAQDDKANDNTGLYITIGGAVAAVAVGGAVGVVYYRKTKN